MEILTNTLFLFLIVNISHLTSASVPSGCVDALMAISANVLVVQAFIGIWQSDEMGDDEEYD